MVALALIDYQKQRFLIIPVLTCCINFKSVYNMNRTAKGFYLFTLLFLILLTTIIGSCKYNSEEELFGTKAPCDTSNVTYSNTITSIIVANSCLNCHVGPSPSGNFTLTSYTDVKAKVDDGRLWGAINHSPGFSPMPQGGNKLTNCEINKIKAWIDAGAPNN